MFVELTTKFGKYVVNVNNILFFYSSKKGSKLELVDGTTFDVEEKYDLLCRIFYSKNLFICS